ncbi:MAG: hypothetical protein R3B65_02225 [Candidatus Paceibacterota bacterium]
MEFSTKFLKHSQVNLKSYFSFGVASRIGDFKRGKKITVKVFGPNKFEKESSIDIPENVKDKN